MHRSRPLPFAAFSLRRSRPWSLALLALLAPGLHLLDLGDGGRFRAGIYLARITQEGRQTSGKYAIVH